MDSPLNFPRFPLVYLFYFTQFFTKKLVKTKKEPTVWQLGRFEQDQQLCEKKFPFHSC